MLRPKENNNVKVTVFTPTYNRDQYICNLFESLCEQTIYPYEWIIIDQGNDRTEQLVREFMKTSSFPIVYKRLQGERGIGRALNQMIDIARGDLVMKVDDDDTLTKDAIECVLKIEATIEDKCLYAGVGGLRKYPNGEAIGNEWFHESEWFDCTNLERIKYGLDGDKAEAYYIHVLKEFGPIPTVSGEYYTWEGILWDRIAHARLKIRWFNKKIYTTQYLEGGATDTRHNAKKDSFFTYTIFVSERMTYSEISLISRIILCCRYFEILRELGVPYKNIKIHFSKSKCIAIMGYLGSCITKYIPQRKNDYVIKKIERIKGLT